MCHLQLITFRSCWSCLGCFPGSGCEMWAPAWILSGIYQVANEMGFIKEKVKWGKQGASTKNQTSFLRLPTCPPAGRWDFTQLREQSKRNADFLEFKSPGSPRPALFEKVTRKEKIKVSWVWDKATVFWAVLGGQWLLSGSSFQLGCARRAQRSCSWAWGRPRSVLEAC